MNVRPGDGDGALDRARRWSSQVTHMGATEPVTV